MKIFSWEQTLAEEIVGEAAKGFFCGFGSTVFLRVLGASPPVAMCGGMIITSGIIVSDARRLEKYMNIAVREDRWRRTQVQPPEPIPIEAVIEVRSVVSA